MFRCGVASREAIVRVRRAGFWVLVALLFLGLVSGCSPPPPPSAETAALEGALLSVEDVGGEFIEEYRGQVGSSGWGLCGEADYHFDDVGMVRAAFLWPLGDDEQVEVVEMMYVVESGGVATLMSDLKAAYAACDGVVWTDYGTTQTVETMAAPEIGDDRLAVRRIDGEPPFDRDITQARVLYVAQDDVFAEITITEHFDSDTDTPSLSDEECYRIATTAIDKLPS